MLRTPRPIESWWNCNYVQKLQQGVYQVQDDISMISTRSGLLDQSITNSMAVLKRLLYLQRSKFYLLRMHHAGEVLRPHLSLPYSPLPQGVSATPPFLPHYSLKLFYSQPKKMRTSSQKCIQPDSGNWLKVSSDWSLDHHKRDVHTNLRCMLFSTK